MPVKLKIHTLAFNLALIALFPLAMSAQSAPAGNPSAGPAPTKIGLVDILRAIQNTNEGQKELDDLQKRFVPKQTELRGLADEIDRLKKELDTQSGKLSDDDRNNKVRAIEAKQKVLQRSYEDAQNEFQQAQQEISSRIYQKMAGVLEKYATGNGYAVVLDVSGQQNTVLWGNTGTVITNQIVEAYNAQSPVPPPSTAPASGAQAKPTGASGTPGTQPPVATTTPKKP